MWWSILVVSWAQAQLLSYAPWPMRGRDLTHSGEALIPAANNSVAVWKYATAGDVESSPAVGTDAIYVGSSDGYL